MRYRRTLTIPNGEDESEAIKVENVAGITFISPSTLPETVTIEVSGERSGNSFGTLEEGGSDVELAAGKALVVSPLPAKRIRLASGANVGADRDFSLVIDEKLPGRGAGGR